MCFSENASIVAFLTGLIGAMLCVSLGSVSDKIVGYFLGFVSLMQGVEYLLWNHQVCDDYNRILSIVGMLLNHLQPIMLGLIILTMNSEIVHRDWIINILFVYSCIIIPYSIQFINNKNEQCTLKSEETKEDVSHLIWNWNGMNYSSIIYTIFLFTICKLSILGFPKLEYGIYAALVAIITYMTSLYYYPRKTVGALWCYYTAFLPIIYYVLERN